MDKVALKDKIKQYGLEVEYPINVPNYCDDDDDDLPTDAFYCRSSFACNDDYLEGAIRRKLEREYDRTVDSLAFSVDEEEDSIEVYDIEWDTHSSDYYFDDDDVLIANLPGEDENATRDYECHEDGCAIEFATPHPMSFEDIKKDVYHIYSMATKLLRFDDRISLDESLFDNNNQGIHIRLDITNWEDADILRFSRLFSTDMEHHSDFVDWMEENFRRDWNNYNKPVDYDNFHSYVSSRRSSDKFCNVHYEYYKFDNAVTLEIRAFGVPRDPSKAVAMFDFVHTLCDIVDHSRTYPNKKPIPELLYDAWNEVVNSVSPTQTII